MIIKRAQREQASGTGPPGGPSSRQPVLNARQRQQGALQAASSAAAETRANPGEGGCLSQTCREHQ